MSRHSHNLMLLAYINTTSSIKYGDEIYFKEWFLQQLIYKTGICNTHVALVTLHFVLFSLLGWFLSTCSSIYP